jgi:outer membrane immunogenic protein
MMARMSRKIRVTSNLSKQRRTLPDSCSADALAADYDLPILRGTAVPAPVLTVGPATFTRWSGFYFGGLFSYGSATSDFSTATRPLVHFSLQHTTVEDQAQPSQFEVLGRGSAVVPGVGGFVGYNMQWQDLITGVEATYTHTNFNTTAPSSAVARIFPSLSTEVGVAASGRLDLTDYGEARFRAGYVVGNLLPYGFMGMAVGRASYSVSTLADVTQTTSTAAPNYSCAGTGVTIGTCQDILFFNSAGQNNALLFGFSVGGGLDWALTQNVFVRGEFDFVQFAPISNISVAIISGRVGAGYKF